MTLPSSTSLRERSGAAIGRLLAHVTGPGARVRHSRFFHPVGTMYRARVVPLDAGGAEAEVAWRLAGDALVRFSGAWWKNREWIDVLGCAIRFRSSPVPTPVPAPRDQDLLFATIRWPWTTLFAPFATHFRDFLANDFHAVSPFTVDGLGPAKWRLRSPKPHEPGRTRMQKLDEAVDDGEANLALEVRRKQRGAKWTPIAEVRLIERVQIDQEALRFSPFRDGRGIRPRGFVQAIRRPTYEASQAARPH